MDRVECFTRTRGHDGINQGTTLLRYSLYSPVDASRGCS